MIPCTSRYLSAFMKAWGWNVRVLCFALSLTYWWISFRVGHIDWFRNHRDISFHRCASMSAEFQINGWFLDLWPWLTLFFIIKFKYVWTNSLPGGFLTILHYGGSWKLLGSWLRTLVWRAWWYEERWKWY